MKVLPVEDGHFAFCLGCKQTHLIPNTWQFNGNLENPTFTKNNTDTREAQYFSAER